MDGSGGRARWVSQVTGLQFGFADMPQHRVHAAVCGANQVRRGAPGCVSLPAPPLADLLAAALASKPLLTRQAVNSRPPAQMRDAPSMDDRAGSCRKIRASASRLQAIERYLQGRGWRHRLDEAQAVQGVCRRDSACVAGLPLHSLNVVRCPAGGSREG